MELAIIDAEGLKEDFIISVRVGDTRRQAPLEKLRKQSLKFPGSGVEAYDEPIRLEILQILAASRLVLRPTESEYWINMNARDRKVAGTGMEGTSTSMAESHLAVGVRVNCSGALPSNAAAGSGAAAVSAAARTRPWSAQQGIKVSGAGSSAMVLPESVNSTKYPDAAAAAREYLETHGLLRYVQAMLHAIIQERPDEPFIFMWNQLGAAVSVSRCAPPPVPRRSSAWENDAEASQPNREMSTSAKSVPHPCSGSSSEATHPELTQLRHKIAALQQEALKVEIATKTADERQIQLEELRKRFENSKQAASTKEADLQTRLREIEETASRKEAELQTKLTEIEEAASKREAELQAKVDSLQKRAEESKQATCKREAELQAKVHGLQTEAEERQQAATQKEAELQAKVDGLQKEAEERKQTACKREADLQVKLDSLQKEAEEARSSSEAEFQTKVSELREEVEHCKQAASKKEAEFEAKVGSLQKDAEESEKVASQKEAELQAKVASLKQEVEQSRHAASKRESELQAQVDCHQKEADANKQAASEKEAEFRHKVASLQQEAEESTKAASKRETQLQAKVGSLQKEVEEKTQEALKEAEKLHKETAAAQQEARASKERVQKLENEMKHAREQADSKIACLQQAVNTQQKDNDDQVQLHKATKDKMDAVQAEKKKREAELDKLKKEKSDHERQFSAFKAEVDKIMKQSTDEVANLKDELAKAQIEINLLREKHTSSLELVEREAAFEKNQIAAERPCEQGELAFDIATEKDCKAPHNDQATEIKDAKLQILRALTSAAEKGTLTEELTKAVASIRSTEAQRTATSTAEFTRPTESFQTPGTPPKTHSDEQQAHKNMAGTQYEVLSDTSPQSAPTIPTKADITPVEAMPKQQGDDKKALFRDILVSYASTNSLAEALQAGPTQPSVPCPTERKPPQAAVATEVTETHTGTHAQQLRRMLSTVVCHQDSAHQELHEAMARTRDVLAQKLTSGELERALDAIKAKRGAESTDEIATNKLKLLDALCQASQEGTLENTLHESDIDASAYCKQKLKNLLETSLVGGTLGTALSDGRLEEVHNLKTRIKNTLETAVKNGTLHGALSGHSSDEAYNVKSRMKDTLEAAVKAGTLIEALPNKMSEEPCSLKSQIKDRLETALKAGTLTDALPNKMSEEPCSLKSQIKHTLETAVKAGTLHDALPNKMSEEPCNLKSQIKGTLEAALKAGTLTDALPKKMSEEPCSLKSQIKDTLETAVKAGTLHDALPNKMSEEPCNLKSQIKDTLETALKAGTLNDALPNKMSEEPGSLKRQIKDTLETAVKAGTLNDALPSKMSEEPCSLKSQIKDTLETAVKAGTLHAALPGKGFDETVNLKGRIKALLEDAVEAGTLTDALHGEDGKGAELKANTKALLEQAVKDGKLAEVLKTSLANPADQIGPLNQELAVEDIEALKKSLGTRLQAAMESGELSAALKETLQETDPPRSSSQGVGISASAYDGIPPAPSPDNASLCGESLSAWCGDPEQNAAKDAVGIIRRGLQMDASLSLQGASAPASSQQAVERTPPLPPSPPGPCAEVKVPPPPCSVKGLKSVACEDPPRVSELSPTEIAKQASETASMAAETANRAVKEASSVKEELKDVAEELKLLKADSTKLHKDVEAMTSQIAGLRSENQEIALKFKLTSTSD